jgi:hypothetical protein
MNPITTMRLRFIAEKTSNVQRPIPNAQLSPLSVEC